MGNILFFLNVYLYHFNLNSERICTAKSTLNRTFTQHLDLIYVVYLLYGDIWAIQLLVQKENTLETYNLNVLQKPVMDTSNIEH